MPQTHDEVLEKKRLLKIQSVKLDKDVGKLVIPLGSKMECQRCGHEWEAVDMKLVSPQSGLRCTRKKCGSRRILINGVHWRKFIESEVDDMGKLKVGKKEPKPEPVESSKDEPKELDALEDTELGIKLKKEQAKRQGVDSVPLTIEFDGESMEIDEPIDTMTPDEVKQRLETPDHGPKLNLSQPVPPLTGSTGHPQTSGSTTITGQAVVDWDMNACKTASQTLTGLITYLGEKIAMEQSPPEMVENIATQMASVLWIYRDYISGHQYLILVFLAISLGRYYLWAFETRRAKKKEKENNVQVD